MGGTLRARAVWLAFSLLFCCLPFAVCFFSPAATLPQYAAQVRLLEELWGLAPATADLEPLVVRAFAPGTLVYWPMFLLGRLFTPALAANLTLLLVACFAVSSVHWLALVRVRSALGALLACTLVFSGVFYAGLVDFLFGFPLLLLFAARALAPWHKQSRLRDLLSLMLLSCLVLWAHLLWLPVAVLCVLIQALQARSGALLVWRLSAFVPAAVWLVYSAPELLGAGPHPPLDPGMPYRAPASLGAGFEGLVTLWFGGVRGWLEPVATAVLLIYAAMTLLGIRAQRGEADWSLLALGLILSAFSLLGPGQWSATHDVSLRFAPFALMLVLLSLPPLRSALMVLSFLGCGLLFSLTTALAWSLYNEEDLAGLSESLALLSRPARVAELDLRQKASTLRGRPFVHAFAYFQAQHGGRGSFSLADLGTGIAVLREPRPVVWWQGLAQISDMTHVLADAQSECFLVNGTSSQHSAFAAASGLSSPLSSGYFRLYCRPLRLQ